MKRFEDEASAAKPKVKKAVTTAPPTTESLHVPSPAPTNRDAESISSRGRRESHSTLGSNEDLDGWAREVERGVVLVEVGKVGFGMELENLWTFTFSGGAHCHESG